MSSLRLSLSALKAMLYRFMRVIFLVGILFLLFNLNPAALKPALAQEEPLLPLIVNGYTLDQSSGKFPIPSGLNWSPDRLTNYQVLQFTGPVKEEWKESLTSRGVRLFDYLPYFGFVAHVPLAIQIEIRRLPFVAYLGPFEPAFRLERGLNRFSPGLITVNVVLFEEEDGEKVAAYMEQLGAIVLKRTMADMQVRIPFLALEKLAATEAVRWVEEARPLRFDNSQASWMIQSGIENYRPVWDQGILGQGQIIGAADTGIDWDHECFYDPNHPQVRYSDADHPNPPDLSHRKIVNYWRLSGDDRDQQDHGTHVAGTLVCDISYLPDNSGNLNGLGMAPMARLSFTDLASSYFPIPSVSDVAIIFDNQYRDGARIHNNSWGEMGGDGLYTAMTRAMDEYMWNHQSFLALVANGNSGWVEPPATAKNIVSVGWGASSKGPTIDGRIKPSVVAYGQIVSADSDGNLGTFNSGYRSMSGTSMSTPSVAGGLALIRQYFVDGWYPTGQPDPANALEPPAALLKAVLLAGTTEVTEGQVDNLGEGRFPNNTQGWGSVNIDGSLHFAGERRKLQVVNQTQGLHTGEQVSYMITVSDTSEPFRVILVWTDYPASYGTTHALVNDLDLRLLAPDGTLYLGNVTEGLDPGHSVPGGNIDRVDVVEGVFLPSPAYGLQTGDYTITVEAYNVPQGPQPFAIVIVGALAGVGTSDTVPPAVVGTEPADGAVEVPQDTTISVTFSEAMYRPSVEEAFSIEPSTGGTLSWDGLMLVFTPQDELADRATYTVTIASSATDLGSNRLPADFTFSFTTTGIEPGPTPEPPRTPAMPTGPGFAYADTALPYFAVTTDSDGDRIQYIFDWGDESTTVSPFLASGELAQVEHTWDIASSYEVRIQAIDETGLESAWSSSLTVEVAELPGAFITTTQADRSVRISGRQAEYQQVQSFTASGSSIPAVSLAVAKDGAVDDKFRLLLSIRSYLGGPSMGWAWIFPHDVTSTDPASPSWVKTSFDRTISLTPGQTYYLVVRQYDANSGAGYLWCTNSANPYSGGMLYQGNDQTPLPSTDTLVKIFFDEEVPNLPPSVPGGVMGPTNGEALASYTFQALAHDADGDDVQIVFDWGEGEQTTTSQVASGTTVQAVHNWAIPGTYSIRAKAIAVDGLESAWGGSTVIEITGPDETPPQISNVTVSSITSSSAIISWKTDEPASSQVEYGLEASYGNVSIGLSAVTNHSVQLDNLAADSLYHFRVLSEDAAGNLAVSEDNTFRTLPLPTTTPTVAASPTPTPTVVPSMTLTSTAQLTPSAIPTATETPTSQIRVLERTIVSSADDSYVYKKYNRWVSGLAEDNIILEWMNWGGLRFTDVTIPRDAQILSAYIEVHVYVNDDPSLFIYSEAVDDAAGFEAIGPLWRTRGSTFVRWTEQNIGKEWRRTPELAPILQEVVDRPGWRSGNALALLWQDTGGRLRFRQWDFDQGRSAARLYVTYEVEGSPEPSPTPSPTLTATPWLTATPTWTAMTTPTPGNTPTPSPTMLSSPTVTPTPSPWPTPSPTSTATTQAGIVNRTIASSADDTYEYYEKYRWINAPSENDVVLESTSWGGLRFSDLPVPQGARIVSANVEVLIAYRDDPSLYIYAQDTDNAADFSASGPRTRAGMRYFVRWYADSIGEGWRTSPDLAPLIQEVVDQPGWRSGNALVLLWQNAGGRLRFRQWDHDGGLSAARLHVVYQVVGP